MTFCARSLLAVFTFAACALPAAAGPRVRAPSRPSPPSAPVALVAAEPAPRLSLRTFRDDDGARFGRVLARTVGPLQLPRVTAHRDGWAFTWSERGAQSQLEVRVAELDADLHERARFTASPEDTALSAFAFAASSGDALGVVFEDDRDSVAARASWFVRLDAGDRAVTQTWTVPTVADAPARAREASIAWSPTLGLWAIAAVERGVTTLHFVAASGQRLGSCVVGHGGADSSRPSRIVWAGDRWALALADGTTLHLVTVRGFGFAPDDLVVAENVHADMTLDWDGEGYGVAWRATTGGVYYQRWANGRAVHPPRVVSAARWASQPTLAWNGRAHVLVWNEQKDRVPSVCVRTFDRDGDAGPARTLMAGTERELAWWPSSASRGEEVAVVWQVGQSEARGVVLTP
jgi:hypothetical protein